MNTKKLFAIIVASVFMLNLLPAGIFALVPPEPECYLLFSDDFSSGDFEEGGWVTDSYKKEVSIPTSDVEIKEWNDPIMEVRNDDGYYALLGREQDKTVPLVPAQRDYYVASITKSVYSTAVSDVVVKFNVKFNNCGHGNGKKGFVNDRLVFSWSLDGSTWDALNSQDIYPTGNHAKQIVDGWLSYEIQLPEEASNNPNLLIRFSSELLRMNKNDTNDYVMISDVEVCSGEPELDLQLTGSSYDNSSISVCASVYSTVYSNPCSALENLSVYYYVYNGSERLFGDNDIFAFNTNSSSNPFIDCFQFARVPDVYSYSVTAYVYGFEDAVFDTLDIDIPTPTPTPTDTPTPTPILEPTDTPTPIPGPVDPTPTPSEEPSPTVEPTFIPSPTIDPTITPTPTTNPEPSEVPEPSEEPTPTIDPTITPTPTTNPEPSEVPEPSEEPTPTIDPTITPTPTTNPEPSEVPEPSEQPTPTIDPTITPTPTTNPEPSEVPEPSEEPTPTQQPTDTPTPTPRPSSGGGGGYGGGYFPGPTITSTPTPTPEPEPTETPTPTPTVIEVPEEETPLGGDINTPDFSDIEGHWAEHYIKYLAKNNIFSGYPEGYAKPDEKITRAEATVMIVNALGLEPVENENTTFTDDDQIPDWAKPYIRIAEIHGIVVGYKEDHTFRAENLINRREAAIILVKAFNYGIEEGARTKFADDEEIPEWARIYVAKGQKLGVITGYPDNTYRSGNDVTRAEFATLIAKFFALEEIHNKDSTA